MDEEPRARRLEAAGADLVIPALALAFALYFFWSITGLAWEASANGVVIGTVLLLLIGIQLVRIGLKVRSGQATLGFGPLLAPPSVLWQRLALIALLALFVATVDWVGTILGLVLVMASMMWTLGVRDRRWLIGLPLAVATALHLMFVVFLGARLPAGVIERLIQTATGGGS